MIGKKHKAILHALASRKPVNVKISEVMLAKLKTLQLIDYARDSKTFEITAVWLTPVGWAWVKLERESR